jgi:undecaprenyl-diphosphatase
MWDLLLLCKAVVMGVVEGLTEFLPVSSTGHLILTADLLDFHAVVDARKAVVFEIFIQLAAILAVVLEYKQRVVSTVLGLGRDALANRFALNVILAFLPLALIGLAFNKQIKAVLFSPMVVASTFIFGGLVILWVEHWLKQGGRPARVLDVDEITPRLALKLGFIQALALIPGMSRSGSTIIGGLCLGLNRVTATQFSFFLAMPTLLAATVYELWGARGVLSMDDLPLFAVGSLASFLSAFVCVRWLLRFVAQHDFRVFAWYRIVFGLIIFASAHFGWVSWS